MLRPLIACAVAGAVSAPALADVVMVLGDSLGFGLDASVPDYPTPSYGDQGWVALWADALGNASGSRPDVINTSVYFETAPSFFSGVEPGRYGLNLNYDAENPGTQAGMFTEQTNTLNAAGETISAVTVAQGGTDSLWLMADPYYLYGTAEQRAELMEQVVSGFRTRYAQLLDLVLAQTQEGTELIAMNVYNPAAYYLSDDDINNDLLYERGEAIISLINAEIEAAAVARGFRLVDLYSAFQGREGELTNMPGLDDIHPNAAGHAVIAGMVIPSPGAGALLAAGGLLALRRRR